jgi:DNA-binding response OmpR family regulator
MRIRPELATILVVEDDAVLGQVLARVLTRDGQIALHVPNTTQALHLLRRRKPRLVLLDASLRDGAALKLAVAIRAACAWIPIILLTTYPFNRSDFPNWLDRLVTKSIDLPELRRTVEAALVDGQACRPQAKPNPVETAFLANRTESYAAPAAAVY